MHSPWYQVAIAWSAVAAEICVVALIVRSKRSRELRFLTAYLCGCIIAHLFLNSVRPSHPFIYFYGYYSWTAIQAILRVLILVDVVESFPGARFLGLDIPMLIFAIAGFFGLSAGAISFAAHTVWHGDSLKVIIDTIMIVDRAVCITWGVFLVVAVSVVRFLRLAWSTLGILLCNGLLINVGGTMLSTYLFTVLPESGRTAALTFGGLCVIAGTTVWGFAAVAKEKDYKLPLHQEHPFLSRLRELVVEKVGQSL